HTSATGKSSDAGAQTIFKALPGRAIRMLKFMSLAGSTAACAATAAAGISQTQGSLNDADLNVVSLALASIVSVASTVAVTKLFGPFVTRITLLPTASKRAVQADRRALPRFDSLLAQSPSKNGVARLSGDSEIVLHSPGILGLNTVDTRVRIGDLVPSSRKFRTWDIKPSAIEARKKQGLRTPVTTFTIMWKSAQSTPTKSIMEEINTLVGTS
ncbi:hypothetical protein LPJ75_004850, partial [Coemansia sp. RSA 2598]